MDVYLQEWTTGDDNFDENPPNATLSVYEPGNQNNVIVVVEFLDPVVEGQNLVYRYVLVDGDMPSGGGAAALFIDRVAVWESGVAASAWALGAPVWQGGVGLMMKSDGTPWTRPKGYVTRPDAALRPNLQGGAAIPF